MVFQGLPRDPSPLLSLPVGDRCQTPAAHAPLAHPRNPKPRTRPQQMCSGPPGFRSLIRTTSDLLADKAQQRLLRGHLFAFQRISHEVHRIVVMWVSSHGSGQFSTPGTSGPLPQCVTTGGRNRTMTPWTTRVFLTARRCYAPAAAPSCKRQLITSFTRRRRRTQATSPRAAAASRAMVPGSGTAAAEPPTALPAPPCSGAGAAPPSVAMFPGVLSIIAGTDTAALNATAPELIGDEAPSNAPIPEPPPRTSRPPLPIVTSPLLGNALADVTARVLALTVVPPL